MPNFVKEHLPELLERHYFLLANKGEHWFNAYPGRVDRFKTDYGDDFCIVLWRGGENDDAYVFPYAVIKHLLTDSGLEPPREGKTTRWLGTVKDDLLRMKAGTFPVRDYYNAFDRLGSDYSQSSATIAHEPEPDLVAITLSLERDLQDALRQNIAQLESGLSGPERSTLPADNAAVHSFQES